MSEEQNDSPAFRLRPRRSAPKSYYAVRLEYSANPAAFIRERPRPKRKAFTQKTGSNSTHPAGKVATTGSAKPNVMSKEEREREERRLLLHRDISESITTNTMISPFIQRLTIDELEPDSLYEHNYITLRIKKVEQSHNRRLISCDCIEIDGETNATHAVSVKLHNEYADVDILKEGKILSITKFRTGPHMATIDDESSLVRGNEHMITLPFTVIVKYDELVERSTSNSNKGAISAATTTTTAIARSASPSGASVNRRPVIPFISVSDMIEQPEEPFVEMCPSSPSRSSEVERINDESENQQESKKVKFTATV